MFASGQNSVVLPHLLCSLLRLLKNLQPHCSKDRSVIQANVGIAGEICA
jgi:hypothetical protein